jgi:large subunit ribosomal protein L22
MKVRAGANDVGISPQKVRFVVNTVKGRRVDEALTALKFLPTPAARAVAKVIKSAAANAENNFQLSPAELKITGIFADKGHTLKRFRSKSRGRISPILKRSTNITVLVEEE